MSAELSSELVDKAEAALVSAIEIYNKPDFRYREESFSILCVNAWELALKAKLLADNNDDVTCLYEYQERPGKDGAPPERFVKPSRSGNPSTIGIGKILAGLADLVPNLVRENLFALIEIRDNATHLVNRSFELRKRVLEVGTASVQNFLRLMAEWFQRDLSRLSLFLMPIGFLPCTAATAVPVGPEEQRLIEYLSEVSSANDDSSFSVALEINVQLKRVSAGTPKSDEASKFILTNDPTANPVYVTEEDIRKAYPWTNQDLRKQLKRRYIDFKENQTFHALKRSLMKNKSYVHTRYLDQKNAKSGKQDFFSPNILQEFDKHYTRKGSPQVPSRSQSSVNAISTSGEIEKATESHS